MYSRHVTGSANCKNSSVSFVMKYSVRLQLFSGILHQHKSWSIDLVVESLSTRSLYFCRKSFLCKNFSWRCRCRHQQSCWLEQWVRLSCQHGSHRSCLTSTVFITQIWDCSVDTELINTYNCATNSFNRIPTWAQKCIDNFPPPLLLSVPRDNGLVARKTGCPHSLWIWSSSIHRRCLLVVYQCK